MPITKATASSIAPAAKGDLVVGSATNDASVLAVGSANQVLTVDSSTSTGLKWAAPASGAYVLIKRSTFTTVSDTSTTFDNVFSSTYKNYVVTINYLGSSSGAELYFRTRGSGTTRIANYQGLSNAWNPSGTNDQITQSNTNQFTLCRVASSETGLVVLNVSDIGDGADLAIWHGTFYGWANDRGGLIHGGNFGSTSNDGFILSASTGTITGQAAVYGLAIS
jgi:hypothetical protein